MNINPEKNDIGRTVYFKDGAMGKVTILYQEIFSAFSNSDNVSDHYYGDNELSFEEPKPEPKWVKFYKVFDIAEGEYLNKNYTKTNEFIEEYELFKAPEILPYMITNECSYEAFIDSENEVFKYRFPDGEVLDV